VSLLRAVGAGGVADRRFCDTDAAASAAIRVDDLHGYAKQPAGAPNPMETAAAGPVW
jgi:hypothetical protein